MGPLRQTTKVESGQAEEEEGEGALFSTRQQATPTDRRRHIMQGAAEEAPL